LHHAEGARVHADEDDPAPALAEAAQVELVRREGVLQRVVDAGDGRGEAHRGEPRREAAGGLDENIGRHAGDDTGAGALRTLPAPGSRRRAARAFSREPAAARAPARRPGSTT